MLNTKLIFKLIIKSIMSATTSKRQMDGGDDNGVVKKMKYDGPSNVIKHYIADKANWDLSVDQIRSLFKSIRIMVLDNEIDRNNNNVAHYHILGEAKVTPRKMRDWSLHNLRAADIKGGLEAKGFYLTSRIKNIEGLKHYQNTILYLQRKNSTVFEDENVGFGAMVNPLWRKLDEAEEPSKHTKEDMDEFKRRFPIINSWKKVAAQRKFDKFSIGQLMSMEAQRKYEENLREFTDEEKHELLPNLPIIRHAHNLRTQLINHDQNSGVCLILCGSALSCKSTINRILGESFGEYAVWPGSQWISRDTLKFDSAARQGISTIVVEEMQWIDIQHRITLEKTINSIKEQLTGAGLDVRLAKTKSNLQDDLKLKIDFLLISMNESEYVSYRILSNLINSKAEYKRRFLLINVDDPKYSDIAVCRNRPDNNWKDNEVKRIKLAGFVRKFLIYFSLQTHMEWLAGKAIKDGALMSEMNGLYEQWMYRQSEVQALLDLVDANPEIFEISEEEAILDDCQKVLDDITNKIEKNEI